jgi:hypothetical protein
MARVCQHRKSSLPLGQVPVPGSNGQKVSEGEFQTHTPGNDKYLVNFNVVPLGERLPPSDLKTYENRAFEANLRQNVRGRTFFTSEKNNGHEKQFCTGPEYNPNETRPPTGNEDWQRWQFVYTGNARVPCWIVAYLRKSFGVTADCGAITR